MIKKLVVLVVLCFLCLSSCRQADINTTDQDTDIATSPSATVASTNSAIGSNDMSNIYAELSECLYQFIPELTDYEEYIAEKSNGEASFYIDWGYTKEPSLKEVYDQEGKYLGKFYLLNVGEHWNDRTIPWAWFYIKEDLKEVLWYDVNTSEVHDLSVWRNGSAYQLQQEALRKEN